MNPTFIATIAGLITAFCWGTSDWLSAKSTKQISYIEVNLAVQTISGLAMAGLLLFVGIHLDNVGQFVRLAGSSILIVTAYTIFLKALSSGVVGIIVPLSNIYPIFTIILTLIFLTSNFSAWQILAMAVIVVGAGILAYEKIPKKVPLRELHKETALTLAAALIWGVAFFILNPVVSQLSWQTVAIISELTALFYSLLATTAIRRGHTYMAIKEAFSAKTAVVAGLIGVIGMMAIYIGSNRSGSVLIPTVLSAGGPLVASSWGALIDHERLGVLKRVGAVVVVAGVVILNAA